MQDVWLNKNCGPGMKGGMKGGGKAGAPATPKPPKVPSGGKKGY